MLSIRDSGLEGLSAWGWALLLRTVENAETVAKYLISLRPTCEIRV